MSCISNSVFVYSGYPSGAYRAHILRLSTGTQHPKTRPASDLLHTPLAPGVRYSLQITIHDAFVAVQFHTPLRAVEEELIIWNWETGSTELVRYMLRFLSLDTRIPSTLIRLSTTSTYSPTRF